MLPGLTLSPTTFSTIMTHKPSITATLRELPVLRGPFTEPNFENFPNTPQEAFRSWLDEAIDSKVLEPHAMTLSTVDQFGYPDARILILKNLDDRGWHFAIKGGSPKALQLTGNNNAALTFYWPEQGRQIRVRGKVVQLPEQECLADFNARPFKSKVSAMASSQSQVLQNRDDLTHRIAQIESAMANEQHPELPDWRVYVVAPKAVEFWQGSNDRLHRRLQYTSEDGQSWLKNLLWP
jgi:pyridoxamine 5'-phosphate oxidase